VAAALLIDVEGGRHKAELWQIRYDMMAGCGMLWQQIPRQMFLTVK
jgi:hypothetical protein